VLNNETKVIDFFTRKPYNQDKFDRHPTSGLILAETLIDHIIPMNVNPLVVDAGCGINPFKSTFDNVIGFDIAPYEEADFQASFSGAHHIFGRNFADVVLALGSCNFGTLDENLYYFDYFHQWLKPGGLCAVRVHINRSEDNMEPGTEYAPWTLANADECAHRWFADKFECLEMHIETMTTQPTQLAVWIWKKK
jgi:hypothetical protein